MRLLPACLIAALAAGPLADAATVQHAAASHPARSRHDQAPARRANAPTAIGSFEDWQAATHVEGGQTVCYAFTRAQNSTPALSGRGGVILTVTERPGSRDAVALSAGFTYAKDASARLQVGESNVALYTAQRSAFARDGHAVIAAFAHASRATTVSPGPHGADVTDSFSLAGFSAA